MIVSPALIWKWWLAKWNQFKVAYPYGDHWRLILAGLLTVSTLVTVWQMRDKGVSSATAVNTALLGLVFITAVIGACQTLKRGWWLVIITAVALASWYISVKSSALVDCSRISNAMAKPGLHLWPIAYS